MMTCSTAKIEVCHSIVKYDEHGGKKVRHDFSILEALQATCRRV